MGELHYKETYGIGTYAEKNEIEKIRKDYYDIEGVEEYNKIKEVCNIRDNHQSTKDKYLLENDLER